MQKNYISRPQTHTPFQNKADTISIHQLLKFAQEGAQHRRDLVPACLSWQMSEEINFVGTEQVGRKAWY